jgi:hypothetical protein
VNGEQQAINDHFNIELDLAMPRFTRFWWSKNFLRLQIIAFGDFSKIYEPLSPQQLNTL